jgi:hypothetical protein
MWSLRRSTQEVGDRRRPQKIGEIAIVVIPRLPLTLTLPLKGGGDRK